MIIPSGYKWHSKHILVVEDDESSAYLLGVILKDTGARVDYTTDGEEAVAYMKEHPEYKDISILERMTEPDRMISFRVCWEDDEGKVQVNRGFRVQFNNAIGPYKGGLPEYVTILGEYETEEDN